MKARNKHRHGEANRPVGNAPTVIQNAYTVFRSEMYRTRYVYHGDYARHVAVDPTSSVKNPPRKKGPAS